MTSMQSSYATVPNELGATLVEYIMATAILVLALLWVNDMLVDAAETRANQAADAVSDMVPCGGRLTGELCR